jgi:hypothetical protein
MVLLEAITLALLLAGIGPPQVERCTFRVTKAPDWVVYVERDPARESCTYGLSPLVNLPGKPGPECGWVLELNNTDIYYTVNDSTLGGCSAPTVACVAGDCP